MVRTRLAPNARCTPHPRATRYERSKAPRFITVIAVMRMFVPAAEEECLARMGESAARDDRSFADDDESSSSSSSSPSLSESPHRLASYDRYESNPPARTPSRCGSFGLAGVLKQLLLLLFQRNNSFGQCGSRSMTRYDDTDMVSQILETRNYTICIIRCMLYSFSVLVSLGFDYFVRPSDSDWFCDYS